MNENKDEIVNEEELVSEEQVSEEIVTEEVSEENVTEEIVTEESSEEVVTEEVSEENVTEETSEKGDKKGKSKKEPKEKKEKPEKSKKEKPEKAKKEVTEEEEEPVQEVVKPKKVKSKALITLKNGEKFDLSTIDFDETGTKIKATGKIVRANFIKFMFITAFWAGFVGAIELIGAPMVYEHLFPIFEDMYLHFLVYAAVAYLWISSLYKFMASRQRLEFFKNIAYGKESKIKKVIKSKGLLRVIMDSKKVNYKIKLYTIIPLDKAGIAMLDNSIEITKKNKNSLIFNDMTSNISAFEIFEEFLI